MKIKNQNQKLGADRNLVCSMLLVIILVSGFVMPVYAVELNAILPSTATLAKPSFQFVRSYVIDYSNGGELKDMLNGQNVSMAIRVDQSDPSVKALIANLNQEVVGDLKSSANITGADITYYASLHADYVAAHIDYKIVFVPTVSNYVLRQASNGNAAIIDTQWRGLTISDPILVNVTGYGQFDVNSPISFVKKQVPNLYNKLQGTNAENLFDDPLMSLNDLMTDPISKWQHLFDPAYTLVDTNVLGYAGQKIVISTYSTGESNISEGTMLPTVKNSDLNLDVDYPVSYTERASDASIQIDGYVAVANIGGIEYFGSSPQAPTGSGISSTGDYPVQVVYSMAAGGVVIAVGIFWWSSRLMKKERERANEIISPSGPIEYETRRHWADRFEDKMDP